jgi:hypothetical protein
MGLSGASRPCFMVPQTMCILYRIIISGGRLYLLFIYIIDLLLVNTSKYIIIIIHSLSLSLSLSRVVQFGRSWIYCREIDHSKDKMNI